MTTAHDAAFLDELTRWIGDAAADEAVSDRRKTRRLVEAASQGATLLGIALDLLEREELVVVRTVTGRIFRGRPVAVGQDFLVVNDDANHATLLAARAVASLRAQSEEYALESWGSRPSPLPGSMRAALGGIAADRRRVQVSAVGEEKVVAGELRMVGEDVLVIALDGPRNARIVVPLEAVASVTVIESR